MKIRASIIGKNSTLYKAYKDEIHSRFEISCELSHSEVEGYQKEITNPIVFCFDPKSYEANVKFLKLTKSKMEGQLVYISTSAVYACAYTRTYNYPALKKKIENVLIPQKKVKILRVGVVKELVELDHFCGRVKLTNAKDFVVALNTCLDEKKNKIIDAWTLQTLPNKSILKKVSLQLLLTISKVTTKGFFLTRPIDLLFRIISFKNYGYTFLSNYHSQTQHKNIVVGSGLSALGVVSAFEDKKRIEDVLLIHDYSSKTFHHEKSNSKRSIEYKGQGGNSNYWHSVISLFLTEKKHKKTRKKFLSKTVSISDEEINKGYSFIPFFPIRPVRKIKSIMGSKKMIDDKVLLYEEQSNTSSNIIYCENQEFFSEKTFLCTGTLSTLNLLFKSNIISEKEVFLDEHLVGYFGQFTLNKKSRIESPKYNLRGHFKKYQQIILSKDRKLFSTFRPALLKMKSLSEASKYRDFFSQQSGSIFTGLIKKLNIALLLEAVYNKFGFVPIKSNTFNITGHITSNSNVKITLDHDKPLTIEYLEKKIELTEEEISSLKKFISKKYPVESILIPKLSKVSPGLHFLNAKFRNNSSVKITNENLFCFSTFLFDSDSITHPSFDLLVDSYDKTNSIIK